VCASCAALISSGSARERFVALKELLKKGSILIVLGTGGVGKTTMAAALGLGAARAGLKTALITVDPARRLRDALGLETLGGKPTGLGRNRLTAAGLDPSLQLSAMMLDTKRAWDDLIERFTADESARERILHNPFYRQLTEQFAGSEAYAALSQLYDLHSSGDFDLIVVDTPPAANAFEFLQAPAHLTRLLDSRMARWLFAPYLSAGRLAMKLASGAARFVVREMERFAGATVLSSISEFFTAAQQTVDGVVERFQKTEALLHSGSVHFVLVTSAEEQRLRQARTLIEEMRTERLNLSAIIMNRFVDEEIWHYLAGNRQGKPPGLEAIKSLREEFGQSLDRHPGLDALVKYLADYRSRTYRDVVQAAGFAQGLPAGLKLTLTPEIRSGVLGLEQLAQFANYLAQPRLKMARLKALAAEKDAGVSL
jgi:anion-transporting  ArsA/GET3 family ATPase